MPSESIPISLAYALRDPNSGALVVPDLYHLHESTWTVRALLPGYPGSTTLGEFTIRLPAPYSDEFRAHASQYLAILNAANSGIGLKVEAYQGSVNAGAPVLSGVITKMNLPLDGPWELSGSDTLYWLQQSQLFPGEQALPSDAVNLALNFFGTREVLWGDDFSNWSGASSAGHPALADYAQTPAGQYVAGTDPLLGLSAIKTGTGAAVITTTATWSNGQFAFSGFGAAAVTCHATMALGTSTTNAGDLGVLLFSDSTGQNAWLVDVVTRQTGTGTGLYNVDCYIYSISGGVATQQAIQTNVLTNVTSPAALEVQAVLEVTDTSSSATVNTVRVILNGKDPNCIWSGAVPPANGHIGVRYGGATVNQLYVTRFTFESRTTQRNIPLGGWGTDRFQQGSIAPAPGSSFAPLISGQGQTHLDVITSALGSIGYVIRKNAGAGAKADTIDVGASLGTDYSSSIVFEEKVNVQAQGSTLQNVGEVYATDPSLKAVPNAAGDSGGSVTWQRIGAPGDMVLTDTVSDVGTLGYSFLVGYARAIQSRKASPLAATQLAVVRTSDLLKANSGWGPRELDFVQVHMPTYLINRQKSMIAGYTITEGDTTVVYYLTQFPESKLPHAALQRLIRSIDFLATTYQPR